MATHDVPGFGTARNDQLGMGCWGEAPDGSLILIKDSEKDPDNGTERVIFEVFDLSVVPPLSYYDAMPKAGFEKEFSWTADGKKSEKDRWLWHNRTPFPWDRVIKAGMPSGTRIPMASGVMTAAQRIADSRRLNGVPADPESVKHRMDLTSMPGVRRMIGGLQRAIGRLRP